MGTFYTSCIVENYRHSERKALVENMLVDTGAESTWISEEILESIGAVRKEKPLSFVMANGSILKRYVGYVVLHLGDIETIEEVVFAQKGDLQIFGAHTMEGMNLRVDPRRKLLVSAGPILTASAA